MNGPLAVVLTQPVFPAWLLAVLCAAGCSWAWLALRGRGLPPPVRLRLFGLRAAALALLAALLLLPERRHEVREQEKPVLAVVVDVSASMNEAVADGTPRARRALEFLKNRAARGALEKFRVWWFEAGDGAEEAADGAAHEWEFSGSESALAPALNSVAARMEGQNSAGILLLSDGLDRSGAAPSAGARGVPVFAVELEPPVPSGAATKPDAAVADLAYPARATAKWEARVDVVLRRRGNAGAETMPAVLTLDGREAQRKSVEWSPGETTKPLAFTFTPENSGPLPGRVEILPAGPDAEPANNRRDFMLEVTDPENRVLYLEGAPRWEFKFLKRALAGARGVRLAAFVGKPGGGFLRFSEGGGADAETGLPEFTREGLSRYKSVILGNLSADALKENERVALRDFVDRGGGLLVLAADRNLAPDGVAVKAPLAELLPAAPEAGAQFREGSFAVDVTAAGAGHPVLQGLGVEKAFPPLLSVFGPVRPAEFAGVLLAAADGSPVLAVRPFGKGRTALLLSDSFWHWQTGDDGGAGRDRYTRFFTQLLQWLGPGRTAADASAALQLLLASPETDVRRRVTVGARLEGAAGPGAAPSCRIRPPSGPELVLPMAEGMLGQAVGMVPEQPGWSCEFRPPEAGLYLLTVTSRDGQRSASTRLLVREPVREQTGAPADARWLRELAAATGGRCVAWDARDGVWEAIPSAARELRRTEEAPLWPRPWWIALLVALLAAEWYWRRRIGLE